MAMVVHHRLHCKYCGLPILLPADTLEQPFSDLDALPNGSLAIGVVCHRCKSLETYFLHAKHPKFGARDGAMVLETRSGDAVLVGILECEEESCESRLPLFAYWNPASNEEERKADISIWRWGRLLCPEGHAILKPLTWP